MAEKLPVRIYDQADFAKFTTARDGETKTGQEVRFLLSKDPTNAAANLKLVHEAGVRYGIILVPEDIGPRANLGRGGAHEAPAAFMSFFMNMQANRFLDYARVLVLGEVEVADLMARSMGHEGDVDSLRGLCQEVDQRVAAVVGAVAEAGIEPIIIGGGNNNSLGAIRGVVEAVRNLTSKSDFGIAVSNCDPHADFRRMEGHHSGNPFTYATAQGFLKRYCVLGLHENYNSEEMLGRLGTSGFKYFSYEDFAIRAKTTFENNVYLVKDYLEPNKIVGCELDLDSIRDLPSSAKTPFGITEEQAAYYIHEICSKLDAVYLQLSEGAPKLESEDGVRHVGKVMALMVVTFLKAREFYREQNGAHVGLDKMVSAFHARVK